MGSCGSDFNLDRTYTTESVWQEKFEFIDYQRHTSRQYLDNLETTNASSAKDEV